MLIWFWLVSPLASLAGVCAFIAILWSLGFPPWHLRSGELPHLWLQVQVTLLFAAPVVYWPTFHLAGGRWQGVWPSLLLIPATWVVSVLPAAGLNQWINGNVFNDATILIYPLFVAAGLVLMIVYLFRSRRLSPPGTAANLKTVALVAALALVSAALPIAAIWLWDGLARGRFG